MNLPTRPDVRPANPRFSSGPCTKPPGWSPSCLDSAFVGRSHRAAQGKERLQLAVDLTRDVLCIPKDYRIGIVPASDTGAMEMALWSLLGARGIDMLAWEAFGHGWISDVKGQLGLQVTEHHADYGALPDLTKVNFDNDVVFTWNGTAAGVRVPNGDFIPSTRKGLTICDATSAAFAQDLAWDKLDVTTFSWQKVLGGEAAHGMLVLSPRAVQRLENHTPPWPMPKIFRLTKGGKLVEAIFKGVTINTPSMLALEDYLHSLKWAQSVGGLGGMIARADANLAAIVDYVEPNDWLKFLPVDPATRSNTSVCLRFSDPAVTDHAAMEKSIVRRLENEGVALDIGSYRDAPPGLRIWAGGTVDTADLVALMPWLGWAFATEKASL